MEDEAAQTLRDLEALKRSTRELLDGAWFPLLLWGALILGSAPFTQIGDGEPSGIYWALAAPAGLAATVWFFRSRELALGLAARNGPAYVALAVALTVAAFALGAAGEGGMLSAVGPAYALAAGLLGFALLARSPLTAVVGAAIAAVATAVLIADPAEPTLVSALGQAAVAIVAGLVAMARRGARRVGAGSGQLSARP
jgi:hypothetical protein